MNNINLASALVFEPRKAFAELAERPRYGFALLLLIVASTVVAVWYQGVVDLAWLTDQQLHNSALGRQLSEDQIAAAVKAAAGRRTLQVVLTGIFTPIGIVLGMLLGALISLLTARITNVQYGYRHWFSLACWSNLPTALASIASIFVLLTASSPQISQADLQPLSLNALLFHLDPSQSGYTVLSYINVLYFWSLFLAVLAVKVWSRRSWLFSFLFTMWLPLLIGAVWAIFALRGS